MAPGRSGAVRLVLGFRRRPGRDRGADLAGAKPRPTLPACGGGARAADVTSAAEPCSARVRRARPGRRRAEPPCRGRGASRAVARRARCDRPLGAAEAGHRRAAHRRFGAARQDRARRMERRRARPTSRRSGTASRRPTRPLFAWLEGRAAPPDIGELPTFCPLMLAQPLEEGDLAALDPRDYLAEWKWDGIRVQLVARGGERRLYSRSGDDIGAAFPDMLAALPDAVTLDGELLVMRDGEVAPFNDLQQRLNRKSPTPKMLRDYPGGGAALRHPARGRRGPARPAVRRAPPAAGSLVRRAAPAPRPVAADRRSPPGTS